MGLGTEAPQAWKAEEVGPGPILPPTQGAGPLPLLRAGVTSNCALLSRAFENLKKEREPGIRGFATSQCRFLRELAARRQ